MQSVIEKSSEKRTIFVALKTKKNEETEFCKMLGKTHVLPVGIDRHRRIDIAVV